MNAQNPLVLIAGTIALLLALQSIARWWRARGYDLKEKNILLTGGSRGLGLVMARQLVDARARVAICARDKAELERARAELAQRGGEILAIPCDVTDRAAVDRMVQRVRERFGAIDILINNAGTDIVGPLETQTLEDFEDTMNRHFRAPLYTMYAILPEMRERGSGRIVNIASIGGKMVSPHMVAYCASKFALVGLSEGMRTELKSQGIAVTTVCPGLIRTGVIDRAIVKGRHREEFARFSIADSLPVISASPEEVASATIGGLRRGSAEVIVPFVAWLGAKFYGLFPGLATELFGWGNLLLPKPDGIGQERALGKDSHSAWSPSPLTVLSDRAARRNNEIPVEEPKTTVEGNGSIDEDAESAFPLVEISTASEEVRDCLREIQDTLEIPWIPANWRAYGMFPAVMTLFWERLKPATETERFLEESIALTERVYADIADWYQPGFQSEIEEGQRRRLDRELNAFSFGNPQLFIQQIALRRSLAGEVVGEDGDAEARRGPGAYRHPEIQLVGELQAGEISPEIQAVYHEIKRTLDIPFVPDDHRAIARYPAFFFAGWEDIKRWRERPEYHLLKQTVIERANEAADRLRPAIVVGEREVGDLFDSPEDFHQLQRTVEMFTAILPELIVQTALFRRGLIGVEPLATI